MWTGPPRTVSYTMKCMYSICCMQKSIIDIIFNTNPRRYLKSIFLHCKISYIIFKLYCTLTYMMFFFQNNTWCLEIQFFYFQSANAICDHSNNHDNDNDNMRWFQWVIPRPWAKGEQQVGILQLFQRVISRPWGAMGDLRWFELVLLPRPWATGERQVELQHKLS